MGRRKKYRKKKYKRDSRIASLLNRFLGSTAIGAGVLCVGGPCAYYLCGDSFGLLAATICGVSVSVGVLLMNVGYRTGQTKEERESATLGLPKPDLDELKKRQRKRPDEYDLDPYRDNDYESRKRRDYDSDGYDSDDHDSDDHDSDDYDSDDDDDDQDKERRVRYRKRDYDRDYDRDRDQYRDRDRHRDYSDRKKSKRRRRR